MVIVNLYPFEKYNKKVLTPSNNEIIKNKPSRSAKLRFAIRSENKFFFPKVLISTYI